MCFGSLKQLLTLFVTLVSPMQFFFFSVYNSVLCLSYILLWLCVCVLRSLANKRIHSFIHRQCILALLVQRVLQTIESSATECGRRSLPSGESQMLLCLPQTIHLLHSVSAFAILLICQLIRLINITYSFTYYLLGFETVKHVSYCFATSE